MQNSLTASRGDLWNVRLDPTEGHEQKGTRPCLIVSENHYNNGPADLVVVIPLSKTLRNIPLHVRIDPPYTALSSMIKCDQIRCISKNRLIRKIGQAPQETMDLVEDRLRILLDL